MNSSTLYPPNFGRFDDVVIGSVLERVRSTSYTQSACNSFSDQDARQSCNKPRSVRAPTKSVSGPAFDEPARTSTQGPKNQLEKAGKPKIKRGTKRSTADATEESMIELRRRRRRANMQRYRNKIQSRGDTLDQECQQLREQIQELELQREAVLVKAAPSSTVWSVTAEYFRLFRHGMKEPLPGRQSSDVPNKGLLSCDWNAQRCFLSRTMAPHVVGQLGSGVETLLREHQIISRCLPVLDTQLVRLDHGDNRSLIATTKVEVIITSNALRLAFPHLVPNGKWATLAAKLLDQRFFVHGSTRFEWDNETSRITVLQTKLDLLTPMLKLLGDVENVARAFDNAAINLDGSVSSAAFM